MKKQHELLSVFLAVTVGVALAAAIIVRTFLPRVIIPHLDGQAMIILSLCALTLDFYIAHKSVRNYILIPLSSAFIFGVFPWSAAFLAPLSALKCAVLGAVIFTVLTFIYDSITDRLSQGKMSKAAPLISALGLYLASQCLVGII